MEIQLTTPALLFSTVSLLMVAYTNRYLAIANLIRNLYDKYQDEHDDAVLAQIRSLRTRISIIRYMQIIAISALLLSTVCMFELFAGLQQLATYTFELSIVLLSLSLVFAIAEVNQSNKALGLQLKDIEHEMSKGRKRRNFLRHTSDEDEVK